MLSLTTGLRDRNESGAVGAAFSRDGFPVSLSRLKAAPTKKRIGCARLTTNIRVA
ncbi:hypothetical protein J7373_16735 [Xanthomonas sp. A2111]|uniref:Uncharacterized protein n=1 Tax=Xanthomonas hawaiiensis TaxID=3003247 RepID=A0ABU2I0R2_9XANT|nr:hypothetical protein [Xanthomonas sp. A2111]MBO9829901.1 hypothetical protein [Xanthomonas sp. A2111]MDS9991734.1 hypothetical protein [Xanthomonas sp. A2111]